MKLQKLLLSLIVLHLGLCHVVGQETADPTPQQIEAYKKNQFKIDRNHGGIGISFLRPAFGSGVEVNQPWFGVNVLTDFLEFKFATGQTSKVQRIDVSPSDPLFTADNNGTDYGYMFSVGANVPVKAMAFGSYKSYGSVFRGHPIIGVGTGVYGFKDSTQFAQKDYENIWFFYLTPGYRIRFPYFSIDLNLEMTAGLRFGNTSEYYRAAGIYPSITIRADALKHLLNPKMVSVNYTKTTVSNVQSNTTQTTSYSRDGKYKTTRYTTRTTGTVDVSSGQIGVEDIGPVAGVGVKYLWSPIARRPYMNSGRMFGVNFYGRGGPLDFGLNIEGGRIGHGSELEEKNDEGKYRRKVERNNTQGVGSISMATAYVNIGFDISSLFLLPFGMTFDKGDATSFFSASAGMIFGGHFAFDQEFENPMSSQAYYLQELAQNPEVKTKFIDPEQHESTGFLTGFYASVHVGALNFTIQNNRYYGAPFASGTMYTVAYRFPIPMN